VTALNPLIGYERSVEIAEEALDTGQSVRDLVMKKGWVTRETLDELLRPENMTCPSAPSYSARAAAEKGFG
jgi:aspartate ammonia-lyase